MTTEIYFLLCLTLLMAWKTLYSKFKITLVAPIFRNSDTKELGGWAKYTVRTPCPPFIGLTIWATSSWFKIRDVQWYKRENYFLCETHYDQPYCNDATQYEHIKKCVVEFGWKYEEVPTGHCLSNWKYD